jgi:tetratricopeptide (TPR) repeat protein
MNKQTDFERELARLDEQLGELGPGALADPLDSERATLYVYRLYKRASLTGNLRELEEAGSAVESLIGRVPHPSDLYYLKANLDFKFHRLDGVRRALDASQPLRESPQGRTLAADLAFQEGRYAEARAGYESLVREQGGWDDIARLAHLESKLGDADRADCLYAEAEDELTAKEMRHYAWVELQRGVLDLKRGRAQEARAHYERAGRAYTGYWMVEEHTAELLGAAGEYDAAAGLYQRVLERAPRPEFMQALGELYDAAGDAGRAEQWYERALAAYLESAARGEVCYYHHLADFFADVRRDGAEAVRWAAKDLELRENFSTQAALAWALYRAGRFAEAREWIERALSSGARDAHLFSQAAAIYRRAGGNGEVKKFERLADEINPHRGGFHVHR